MDTRRDVVLTALFVAGAVVFLVWMLPVIVLSDKLGPDDTVGVPVTRPAVTTTEEEPVLRPPLPFPVPARVDPGPRPRRRADRPIDVLNDLSTVNEDVSVCLRRGEPVRTCERPELAAMGVKSTRVVVRVRSRTSWRVTGRTRGVRPAFTYTIATDLTRRRRVATCSPRSRAHCAEPRHVEPIPSS